jgi:hypothetical protein
LEFIAKENSKMLDIQRRMGMLFKQHTFPNVSFSS